MEKKHLQLFLIFLWISSIAHCAQQDNIPRTFKDIYSKLTSAKEKKDMEPVHLALAKCPIELFNDTAATSNSMYCYEKLMIRDYKNRIRNLATNQYSNIIPCESNNDCYNNIGIDTNCDLKTGHKYVSQDGSLKNGICIHIEPFAYIFEDLFKEVLTAEKRAKMSPVSMPVLYDPYFRIKLDNCRDEGKGCGNGQFCSAMDSYPEELPAPDAKHYCYFLPKLPDLNIGHKLAATLPNQDLALCQSDPDCTNESEESWSCDLSTGRIYARGIDGKKVVFDGLCVRTPPISVSNADKYINLSVSTTYAQRLQYFPVDFERLSQDKPIKKCSSNGQCVEGAICEEVYDYATKSKKPGVKYCFKGERPQESGSILIYVVIFLVVLVILIILGLTIWRLKKKNKIWSKKKDKKDKKDKKGSQHEHESEKTSTTEMRKDWNDVTTI